MSFYQKRSRAKRLLVPAIVLTLIWIGGTLCSIAVLGVEIKGGVITFRWAARPPNAGPTAPGPSVWPPRARLRFDGIGLLPHHTDSSWCWMPPSPKVGQIIPTSALHRLDLLLWPAPVVIFLAWMNRSRRPSTPPGVCRQCGYSLTGNVSGICPECGDRI